MRIRSTGEYRALLAIALTKVINLEEEVELLSRIVIRQDERIMDGLRQPELQD